MKKICQILMFVLLASSLVIGGYKGEAASQASAPAPAGVGPIKIGALLSLTGPEANLGPANMKGIQMRFEEAGWKVAGRPIEFIPEDDAFDPAKALEKAKKLVEADKVKLILGPVLAGCAMSTQPYLSQVPVPSLTLQQQIAEAAGWGWFFLTSGTVIGRAKPVGWYAYENLGARTAVCLSRDDIAGKMFIGGWEMGFKEKGGKVIQELWAPMGCTDFSSYLLSMKKADVVGLWHGTAIFALKQADELGLLAKMPWTLAHQGGLIYEQLQELGAPALKIKAIEVTYSPLIDTPANKAYVERSKKGGYGVPDPFRYAGYEAASIALAALQATGGDTDPNKLKQAILGVKMETPKGLVSFTPQGMGISDLYIFNVVKTAEGIYQYKPIKKYAQYVCKFKE